MEHQIEYVDPATLRIAEYNPRRIGEDALRRLAKLLDAHGFVDPVIARREDRLVIGGHQRLAANRLRKNPDSTVPVVFLEEITDAQAKALNIALNSPGAQGEFDIAKLGGLLAELDGGDFDLAGLTGFSDGEIADLVEGRGRSGATTGEVPEVPFTSELMEESNYVLFVFDNTFDWNVIEEAFGLETVKSLKTRPGFLSCGIGRVIDGKKLLELIGGK